MVVPAQVVHLVLSDVLLGGLVRALQRRVLVLQRRGVLLRVVRGRLDQVERALDGEDGRRAAIVSAAAALDGAQSFICAADSLMPSRIAAGTLANAGQLGKISSAWIANKKWPWRPQPLQCPLRKDARVQHAELRRDAEDRGDALDARWACVPAGHGRDLCLSARSRPPGLELVRAREPLARCHLGQELPRGWVGAGLPDLSCPRSAVESAATSAQERWNRAFSSSPHTVVAKSKNGPHPCCANTLSSVIKTWRDRLCSSSIKA